MKRLISLILCTLMILTAVPFSASAGRFDDVAEGKWYSEGIEFCAEMGYMDGTSERIFDRNSELTRSMFMVILSKIDGVDLTEYETRTVFNDVAIGKWYTGAITWAAENNLASGIGDNAFGYKVSITREQMALFFYVYAQYKGISTTETADISSFDDADRTHDWARSALEWAVANELLSGIGNNLLSPRGTCTRAQAAVIVHAFAKKYMSNEGGDEGGDEEPPVDCEHEFVDPTCTEDGYCSLCGEIGVEANGHIGSQATCTVPSICEVCGEEVSPTLDHTVDETSCTEASVCSICGTEVAPATGHEPSAATCIDPSICVNCGEVLSPELGHTATEVTCTQNSVCTVCGIELVHAYGHIATTATCTSPSICEVCGVTLSPALGHDWALATCITASYCKRCGAAGQAALGHTEVVDPPVAPTYNSTGLTGGSHCSVCGKVIIAQQIVPALIPTCTHSWAAPTCTADGYCRLCGAKGTAATGHTEVIDEAVSPTQTSTGLTEGSHCSVCGTVIVAQQEIPKLSNKTHSIIYRNLKNAETPTITSYNEDEGLLDMPVIECDGYEFVGWYTASVGGEVVDYIPEGSTKTYILYARWETVTYNIYYFEAPEHSNVETYTVEDRILLSEPKWSGLKFTGWEDAEGNKYTEIPKGTSGDLELTATWKLQRNIANQGGNSETLAVYDDANELFYYIYEIGTIEHVVLEELNANTPNMKYHTGAGDLEFGLEQEISIEKGIAESIAKTVSESVSSSTEWENSTEWAKEESHEHNVNVTVGVEVEVGIVKGSVEAGYGYTNTSTSSWGGSSSQGGSKETENGVEYESGSELSYLESLSTSVTANITIEKDMPEGYYSYVHAGNVRVFGIVVYNPATGNFHLSTYSMLDNMHEMVLYYPNLAALNSQSCETLEYNIPRDEILNMVENAYYVAYDANGGTGEMKMTAHTKGEKQSLLPNAFSMTGYTFSGWELREEDDSYTLYPDGSTVLDIADSREVVTLYAHWTPNNYTIAYNENKPANASGTVTNIPAPTVCKYDADVTLAAAPTLTGWSFAGWYLDSACTKPVGKADAVLSTPNFTANANEAITLYAKWTANNYTVVFNSNGGSLVSSKTVTYDTAYGPLTEPTRENYRFLGWYDKNGSPVTANTILTTASYHSLTAKWVLITSIVDFTPSNGNRDKTVTDDDKVFDVVTTSLNKSELKALGYTKIKISCTFDIHEINDGYQELWIYTKQSGIKLGYKEFETKDSGWHSHSYSVTVDIDSLLTDANGNIIFTAEFGAHGSGKDNWTLGTTQYTASAQ